MANTLIQKYLFHVPATTGTPRVYSYNFKSDELHKYLTGIACPLVSASLPTADSILIELRDDYRSILSFSPAQNWIKDTTSTDFDLTEVFRPLMATSAGKNFYINVKVTNSATPFDFIILFRQDNELQPLSVFGKHIEAYDMQSFTIPAPVIGTDYNFNLPSDFNYVAGVNIVGGDPATFNNLLLEVNDSVRNLLDPMPLSCLKVRETVKYNNSFFPVSFISKNKEVNIRLSTVGTVLYTATPITVTFLLTR